MYSRKLLAAGGGVLAYGVLLGWAFTADRWEQKNKVLERIIFDQDKQMQEQLRQSFLEGPVATEEDLSDRPARVITNGEIHSVSLVTDPPHPSWRVTSVDGVPTPDGEGPGIAPEVSEGAVVDTDPEISPEGNAGESDETPEDEEGVIPEGETPEETTTKLQALIDRYTANPDDVDTFVTSAQKAIKTADELPPFVISRDKYAWDEEEGDEYAKITLKYFPRDRLLLDDDDEVIVASDVDAMVGWRSLTQFGGESGDPDVVYVRNRRLRTDFEVVKDDENDPPIHVRYSMSREEFNVARAAGVIKMPREVDRD